MTDNISTTMAVQAVLNWMKQNIPDYNTRLRAEDIKVFIDEEGLLGLSPDTRLTQVISNIIDWESNNAAYQFPRRGIGGLNSDNRWSAIDIEIYNNHQTDKIVDWLKPVNLFYSPVKLP